MRVYAMALQLRVALLTASHKTVQNYAQLRSQRGPKWSQMVENGLNSIKNLLKEKKVSVTHGKKGI